MSESIDSYDFAHAALDFYAFFWSELCDWYLEIVKPRLYGGDEDAAANLLGVLERVLAVAHPLMPFVTEEIWAYLPDRERLLLVSPFPVAEDDLLDPAAEREIGAAIDLVRTVRRWRDLVGVPAGSVLTARVEGDQPHELVARLARLRFEDSDGEALAAIRGVELLASEEIDAGEARSRIEAERERLRGEIERLERKLANQGFVDQGAARGGRGRAAQARRLPRRAGRAGLAPLAWSAEQAEAYLASLEPLGIRFGLERIRRLVSVLGMPQHRFASIHVVGTNGKSAVTEMTAALLEAHGTRPAPTSRLMTSAGRSGSGFAVRRSRRAPSGRRSSASPRLSRRSTAALDEGESVTQFEADTATAFVALAAAGVEVAVIEAGLGGRLDATNVLPSTVTALTSIGLEHTEWLGETEVEIAAEKLAVLRDHSKLVLGPVSAEVEEVARRTVAERHAGLITVRDLAPAVELPTPAPYLRRDFAVALAAAEALLGALDPERALGVAAGLGLPGRMEVLETDPPVLLDAAHNPAGASALAEALPAIAGGRPVVAALAVLADKDSGRDRRGARPADRGPRRDGGPGAAAGERREARGAGAPGERPRRDRPRGGDRLGGGGARSHGGDRPCAARSPAARAGSCSSPARTICSVTPADRPPGPLSACSRRRNSATSRFSQSVWSLVHPSRSLKWGSSLAIAWPITSPVPIP